MESGFVLGLGAITLSAIGLVIYFGRKLSESVRAHILESELAGSITLTGSALAACIVGFWVVCLAARALAPEGSLGAFLARSDGVVVVFVASISIGAIAAVILEKLGCPILKRGGRGT